MFAGRAAASAVRGLPSDGRHSNRSKKQTKKGHKSRDTDKEISSGTERTTINSERQTHQEKLTRGSSNESSHANNYYHHHKKKHSAHIVVPNNYSQDSGSARVSRSHSVGQPNRNDYDDK